VTSVAELLAALSPENAGGRILVRAGTYALDQGIEVPEGVALIGEGVMQFDDDGLPSGIMTDGRTVIAADASVVGDFVTLGHGSSLQHLVIQDAAGRVGLAGGGVVTVSSDGPGDFVAARVSECEIINPNPSTVGRQWPAGRGIVAITRNLNLNLEPSPDEDSLVTVDVNRSIIRSPGGGSGVFGINFAARSRVELRLFRNVIGGGIDISGGVSRPDAVSGSVTAVYSLGNWYRSDSALPTAVGWTLIGGTDAPVPGLIAEGATSNLLSINSAGDRIEGFAKGIVARAGRRSAAVAGASSDNQLALVVVDTTLHTTVADLELYGAQSLVASAAVGDRNVLTVVMARVSGSGLRTNVYADSSNGLGTGNRLVIEGSLQAFEQRNPEILPLPPANHFRALR
jgi:hypothetical protein